jgi:hypothetical protein
LNLDRWDRNTTVALQSLMSWASGGKVRREPVPLRSVISDIPVDVHLSVGARHPPNGFTRSTPGCPADLTGRPAPGPLPRCRPRAASGCGDCADAQFTGVSDRLSVCGGRRGTSSGGARFAGLRRARSPCATPGERLLQQPVESGGATSDGVAGIADPQVRRLFGAPGVDLRGGRRGVSDPCFPGHFRP